MNDIRLIKPMYEVWHNTDGEFGMKCGWMLKTHYLDVNDIPTAISHPINTLMSRYTNYDIMKTEILRLRSFVDKSLTYLEANGPVADSEIDSVVNLLTVAMETLNRLKDLK